MKTPPFPLIVCVLSLCLFASYSSALGGDGWKPVNPAELSLKNATVEKDADAEALFWEVKIDDSSIRDLILNHYIRIKVFTDRGREAQSRIDLQFGRLNRSEVKIQDIAARTIKPDGSIVELQKADVFERTIVKASGLKVKAKSFAMPAVEAGCIIEYRWREVRVNADAHYVRLQVQREIPVQNVKYFLRPFPYPDVLFRSITFHGPYTPFVKEKDGFYSLSMSSLPAMVEESRMPPEDQVKIWILVYYTKDEKLVPEKYWPEFGKKFYEETKSLLKTNDEVRQMAATLTSNATSDEEKLRLIFEFCRNKIKNTSDDASGLTAEQRKNLKENKSPADTLKREIGTAADIDLLFAALASASGFDARIVLAPDRGDIFFDKSLPNAYFLEPSNIAVNVGGTWKFFNPGYNYIPFGMLRWQEEGEQALITDAKQPVWVETPLTSHDKSVIKRRAKVKIAADGTVEGDVTVEFTGHFAIERKEDSDHESETEREESIKNEIKARMSTAEISNIRIENVTDHVKPFICSYHIRIPGYGERTGKRIFLRPALFQYGAPALFSTTERRHPIYFHFPWSEEDQVEIELPTGYALDNADAPAPFNSGAVTAYKPSLAVSRDGRFLIYRRNFFFGGGGAIVFPVQNYSTLKALFDAIHQQDRHSIALKQAEPKQ